MPGKMILKLGLFLVVCVNISHSMTQFLCDGEKGTSQHLYHGKVSPRADLA